MKVVDRHAALPGDFGDGLLGLIQRPVGRQEARVLVGVGVADHDLEAPPPLHVGPEDRVVQQPCHHLGGVLQVAQGFKERHHIEGQGPPGAVEPHLPRQQHHLEQVAGVMGHRDHMRPTGLPLAQGLEGGLQAFALGPVAHRGQGPGRGQLPG